MTVMAMHIPVFSTTTISTTSTDGAMLSLEGVTKHHSSVLLSSPRKRNDSFEHWTALVRLWLQVRREGGEPDHSYRDALISPKAITKFVGVR